MPRRKEYSNRKEYSTFDPKLHFKSKGGSGYQMKKRNTKTKEVKIPGKPTKDGLEIAKVFRWDVSDRYNSK